VLKAAGADSAVAVIPYPKESELIELAGYCAAESHWRGGRPGAWEMIYVYV
jgi:hypothetical protein